MTTKILELLIFKKEKYSILDPVFNILCQIAKRILIDSKQTRYNFQFCFQMFSDEEIKNG